MLDTTVGAAGPFNVPTCTVVVDVQPFQFEVPVIVYKVPAHNPLMVFPTIDVFIEGEMV